MDMVSYGVSVVTGSGGNRWDDNAAKDLVGRVVVTPPKVGGLSVGFSVGTGEQPSGRRTRSSLGFVYNRRSFKISAEGLRETLGGLPAGELPEADQAIFEDLAHAELDRFTVTALNPGLPIAVSATKGTPIAPNAALAPGRQAAVGPPDRAGAYVLGVYRIRPASAHPHFHMVDFFARFMSYDQPAPTKEWQLGGNYYLSPNVRFMLDGILPVDGREPPPRKLLARTQILF
jgi:hypothetical protein